tara:strand:- start:1011 stop:1295 length:285 start_codon:yes stop_codon:yes gene_type:complete
MIEDKRYVIKPSLSDAIDLFDQLGYTVKVDFGEKREGYHSYDGYQEILDNVRMIIRMNAPEQSVIKLVKEINNFEDELTEMIDGRQNDLSFTKE